MRLLSSILGILTLVVAMLPAGLAGAQDVIPPAAPEDWQAAITGQIEAFRHRDAPAALSYAGASFQRTFPTPASFFEAIIASGYAPIMTSRSHSFGEYERIGKAGVLQVVMFVGPNLELYEAVYDLLLEAGGWRVQGVMLSAQMGVSI